MATIVEPRPVGGGWRGWRASSWGERLWRVGETLAQSVKDLFTDSAPQWAAAVAYYSLLSLFPLLLAAATIASFFVEPTWAVERLTAALGEFVPQGGDRIEVVVREALAARGGAGVLSTLALLWSGSRVFGTLTVALNIAYDYDETYGFFKRLLVEVLMLLTAGVVFILALAAGPLIDLLGSVARLLPGERGFVFGAVRRTVPALLLLVAFTLFYRLVPRGKPAWRAAGAAAGVATLLFLLARPLFLGYVGRFGEYNLVYGSLAVVIVLVLWAYVVALITLFGGELAAHIQRMLVEGEPTEEIARRHQERAVWRNTAREERKKREAGGVPAAAGTGTGQERPPDSLRPAGRDAGPNRGRRGIQGLGAVTLAVGAFAAGAAVGRAHAWRGDRRGSAAGAPSSRRQYDDRPRDTDGGTGRCVRS